MLIRRQNLGTAEPDQGTGNLKKKHRRAPGGPRRLSPETRAVRYPRARFRCRCV